MFVALPFLSFFMHRSLYYLRYTTRVPVCCLTGFTCPLLWVVCFITRFAGKRLPDALWGAIAGYGGFALIYWGYRLRYQKEGLSGYGDVKYLAALGRIAGKHCRYWFSLPLCWPVAGLASCATGERQ